MKTSELLIAMERGFAGLRSEFAGRFDQMDGRLDQMDVRFDQIDGHLEKNAGRLGRLEEGMHKLGMLLEDSQVKIELVAEGVANCNEKLDRHREETAKGFDDVRAEIRAHAEPLRLRIEALEQRCP